MSPLWLLVVLIPVAGASGVLAIRTTLFGHQSDDEGDPS